jgi:hypothetical protein
VTEATLRQRFFGLLRVSYEADESETTEELVLSLCENLEGLIAEKKAAAKEVGCHAQAFVPRRPHRSALNPLPVLPRFLLPWPGQDQGTTRPGDGRPFRHSCKEVELSRPYFSSPQGTGADEAEQGAV